MRMNLSFTNFCSIRASSVLVQDKLGYPDIRHKWWICVFLVVHNLNLSSYVLKRLEWEITFTSEAQKPK